MIYLDYAATTPMTDEVLQIYHQVSKSFFGNPSSLHDTGSKARLLLEKSREELATLLSGLKSGIYFTGGGSEANNLALSSLIDAHKHKGNHLITTASEHASVFNFFNLVEQKGFEVTYLSGDENGVIRLDDVKQAIRETTILVSIQHGNGEIGTIQPIAEIGNLLERYGILFHSDCVQTFGKIPLDVQQMKLDSLSISSHKIYGPKGMGAVYINPNVKWCPQVPGSTHESGFRPGTENIPGIAAFITAAMTVCSNMNREEKRLSELKHFLAEELFKRSSRFQVEGEISKSLPHILGISIKGMEGQYAMLECNRSGIAISTGSACQTGNQYPSRTMLALGKSDIEAKQFIRLSFGKQTTKDEIIQTANKLAAMIEKFFPVRSES
ncbi:MAG TPA: IscS subfamily cysteine desulfurase [Virgibacillus sp.]|nr:IscS subfamily cysteine desulfurase [Virgibacillus sp.]